MSQYVNNTHAVGCNSLQQYSRYTQDDSEKIFNQQLNFLTSGPVQTTLYPKVLYGNTALSAQDPDNPITYFLFRKPS